MLTDYHLSDGDTGTQVIAALRDMTGSGLKAILTTGDTLSAEKDLPQDFELRVASKPIHADDLLLLVRALLARGLPAEALSMRVIDTVARPPFGLPLKRATGRRSISVRGASRRRSKEMWSEGVQHRATTDPKTTDSYNSLENVCSFLK